MHPIVAVWDSLTLQNVQAVLPLFQGLSSLGVIVSIFIYLHQRRAASKAEASQRAAALEAEIRQRAAAAEERQRDAIRSSEQQANRSRLTEAYMNAHAYILQNPDNVGTAERLIRRGAGYVQFDREGGITRAIELLYLKLNWFCAHVKENVEDLETIRNTIFHRYGSDLTYPLISHDLEHSAERPAV
jgi:hypothetical protein